MPNDSIAKTKIFQDLSAEGVYYEGDNPPSSGCFLTVVHAGEPIPADIARALKKSPKTPETTTNDGE